MSDKCHLCDSTGPCHKERGLICLERQLAQSTEKEADRWAERFGWIRGDGFDWIDGAGCESGDTLDIIESEVKQRINAHMERVEELEEDSRKHVFVMESRYQKILELEAAVEKLPKTADGVPVVPGMMIYEPPDWKPLKVHSVYVFPDLPEFHNQPLHNMYEDCYSTKAAAQAKDKQ